MRGLDWGRLYETYHSKSYNAAAVDADVDTLRADPAVLNNKGIYEYLLGGKTDPKLLDVRLFDDQTKVAAYEQQTQKAKAAASRTARYAQSARCQQDPHLQAERDGR